MQGGFVCFCVHMETVRHANTVCPYNTVSVDLFEIQL